MSAPTLLDLFSGEGGAAMGYANAGHPNMASRRERAAVIAGACTESMARYSRPHPAPTDIPGERRRWAPSHAKPHVKYRSIIEGRCPLCDGPLERQAICGWCEPCKAGWTYQGSPMWLGASSERRA